MGQQQTQLLAQQTPALQAQLTDVAAKGHALLAENAPSLLARINQAQGVQQPTGFQPPDSEQEIIIAPVKSASPEKISKKPDRKVKEIDPLHDGYNQGLASHCQGEYHEGDMNLGYCDEDHHQFPSGNSITFGDMQQSSSRRPESIEQDDLILQGHTMAADAMLLGHTMAPDAILQGHAMSGDARYEGLTTEPNGLYDYRGEFHANIGTEYHANVDHDRPYEAYHANSNFDGPCDDVPPTNPYLYTTQNDQYDDVPPTNPCLYTPQGVGGSPPPFPYPAVHGREPAESAPQGFGGPPFPYPAVHGREAAESAPQGFGGPPFPYPAVSEVPPQRAPPPHTHAFSTGYSDESPPNSVGHHGGQAVPSFPPSPSGQQSARSPHGSDIEDRDSWKVGSIVEVYSSSGGTWHVGRVISLPGEGAAGVITVQFVADDGPKQKSVYRNDSGIVPLGSRNGGICELPPGFQQKASQSRPGHHVFLDATTGIKYSSPELAWTVHFERLASYSAEMGVTVANLRDGSSSYTPMGTAPVSSTRAPPPQLSTSQPDRLSDRAPLIKSNSQSERPPAISLAQLSERPPAMSLAQLMNMKPLDQSRVPDSSLPSEWGDVSNVPPPMPAMHPVATIPTHQEHVPAPRVPAMPPVASGSQPMMQSNPKDSNGKIALPSFGDSRRFSNQAAYLKHEASYLQNLDLSSSEYSHPDYNAGIGAAPENDSYPGNFGNSVTQRHSVPRRPAPPPQRATNPAKQEWNDDPFSQWRR